MGLSHKVHRGHKDFAFFVVFVAKNQSHFFAASIMPHSIADSNQSNVDSKPLIPGAYRSSCISPVFLLKTASLYNKLCHRINSRHTFSMVWHYAKPHVFKGLTLCATARFQERVAFPSRTCSSINASLCFTKFSFQYGGRMLAIAVAAMSLQILPPKSNE